MVVEQLLSVVPDDAAVGDHGVDAAAGGLDDRCDPVVIFSAITANLGRRATGCPSDSIRLATVLIVMEGTRR